MTDADKQRSYIWDPWKKEITDLGADSGERCEQYHRHAQRLNTAMESWQPWKWYKLSKPEEARDGKRDGK